MGGRGGLRKRGGWFYSHVSHPMSALLLSLVLTLLFLFLHHSGLRPQLRKRRVTRRPSGTLLSWRMQLQHTRTRCGQGVGSGPSSNNHQVLSPSAYRRTYLCTKCVSIMTTPQVSQLQNRVEYFQKLCSESQKEAEEWRNK